MPGKSLVDTIERMRAGQEVSFSELERVCRHYFGAPRIKGSHHVFKMPWAGDPRINIQNDKGKAKRYQVKQVLEALDRLAEDTRGDERAKEQADKPRK